MDGIEKELSGRARVLRVDVLSTAGRQLAARYGVRGVPTLIIFDGHGQPREWHVGRIKKESVLKTVAQLED